MLEKTKGIQGIGGFGSGPRQDPHPRPRQDPAIPQPPDATPPGAGSEPQQSIRSLASRLEALQGELSRLPTEGGQEARQTALRRIAEIQVSMANLAGAGTTTPSSEQVSKAVSALAAALHAPEGSRVLTLLGPRESPTP